VNCQLFHRSRRVRTDGPEFMSNINEDRPYAPNAEMRNNWRFLREKYGLSDSASEGSESEPNLAREERNGEAELMGGCSKMPR